MFTVNAVASKLSGGWDVTITHNSVSVRCDDVAIWDDSDVEGTYYEWLEMAEEGEEGYTIA